MSRIYSLAYLTASECAPPAQATLAAELGYAAIGVRIAPAAKDGPFWPLVQDRALLAETQAQLRATGVKVLDVEIVWLTPDFDVTLYAAFLDVCAALGARSVLVGGADTDISRLTASFAALCAAAQPLGVAVDLEFMPWTAVADAATAARVVADAGAANGGLLVDALHFARAGTQIAEIAALPRSWLHYAQICDGPAVPPASTEGMMYAARFERLLPGEGGIELRNLFAAMPADMPVSIELPNAKIVGEIGVRAWAARALAASRRVLDSVQDKDGSS